MNKYLDYRIRVAEHAERLAKLGKVNGSSNVNALHSDLVGTTNEKREPLTARSFVRLFGEKAKRYRLTNRTDFVGLMILGNASGFVVKRDETSGKRYIARVDVVADARVGVQVRFVEANKVLSLRSSDSVSNLQRGLLKWVY